MIQRQGKKIKGGEKRNPEKLDALISVGGIGASQCSPAHSASMAKKSRVSSTVRELIHIPFNLKCLLGNSRILFKSIPLVLFVKIICHFKNI